MPGRKPGQCARPSPNRHYRLHSVRGRRVARSKGPASNHRHDGHDRRHDGDIRTDKKNDGENDNKRGDGSGGDNSHPHDTDGHPQDKRRKVQHRCSHFGTYITFKTSMTDETLRWSMPWSNGVPLSRTHPSSRQIFNAWFGSDFRSPHG